MQSSQKIGSGSHTRLFQGKCWDIASCANGVVIDLFLVSHKCHMCWRTFGTSVFLTLSQVLIHKKAYTVYYLSLLILLSLWEETACERFNHLQWDLNSQIDLTLWGWGWCTPCSPQTVQGFSAFVTLDPLLLFFFSAASKWTLSGYDK